MLYNLFENRAFVSVFAVALLAEGVDRNAYFPELKPTERVALLAEGVDRNAKGLLRDANKEAVALLAEGVDRNGLPGPSGSFLRGSPSSRRAWIEIPVE